MIAWIPSQVWSGSMQTIKQPEIRQIPTTDTTVTTTTVGPTNLVVPPAVLGIVTHVHAHLRLIDHHIMIRTALILLIFFLEERWT